MKMTRRTFLVAGGLVGGGLVVGAIGIGAYVSSFDLRQMQREALEQVKAKMVANWIILSPDGSVRILSPHTEMGQGAQTGLLQIVLDEMDADPARTAVEQAPASPEFTVGDVLAGFLLSEAELPGWTQAFAEKALGRAAQLAKMQFTGGSTTIRFTGWRGMRHAAAAARQMLAEAGAQKLGVPVSEVKTQDGRVMHARSGKSVDYGELVDAAAAMQMPANPAFKPREQRKYIGQSFPRVDLPDKVFAKAVYGIDVAVPGMRYAAVAPAPIARGRCKQVTNEAELLKRRGVEAVVVMDDAVAVVADNPWRAEQAARAAQIDCEPPAGGPIDSAKLLEAQRAAVASGKAKRLFERGDAPGQLADAEVVEAEYTVPFLAHAPMEPLNATMWEEGGKVHVATGVQNPLTARAMVADELGLDLEDVTFHAHTMGGGFGRRNAMDGGGANWLLQTARVWKKVGGAVKLTWSREADIRLSNFRPADVARLRAKLGPDGKPVAWHGTSFAGIGAPQEATPVYDIPHVAVDTVDGDPALPYAYWRSVDASSHGFFVESFIDELARKAGQDPIAYRVSLLGKHPRHRKLLETVARMSGWPNASAVDRALGVAIVESFGSIVAQVAEVSLENGRPRVHQVWCAIDCGLAINPGGVQAQMEGGVFFGMTAAMYGQITVNGGQIAQSNFHDYRMVQFADGPRVHVEIVESGDDHIGGAGEPGVPPVAPAIGNAIAALKERQRGLPFTMT